MKKMVVCVVLNWRRPEDTVACIQSLLLSVYDNLRIVVVDNGSNDGSAALIEKTFSHIDNLEVISLQENVGFSAGNNVGIRHALGMGADFVWILNNDTVVHREALTNLVKVLEDNPKAGAVGATLFHMDRPNVVQGGAGDISVVTGFSRGHHGVTANGEVDYLCGASLVLRREAIEEVGLVDEGYFLYWEDSDLSLRLGVAGWQLFISDAAVVWHQESMNFVYNRSMSPHTYLTDLVTSNQILTIIHGAARNSRLAGHGRWRPRIQYCSYTLPAPLTFAQTVKDCRLVCDIAVVFIVMGSQFCGHDWGG
jgi:GT2 family glycosyltransferase